VSNTASADTCTQMNSPGRSYAVARLRRGRRASLIRQRSVIQVHLGPPINLPGVARTLTARDGVVAGGPEVGVDEYEAGYPVTAMSLPTLTGLHSRPRQPTHRE
jgi:hypothetical protein